MGSYRDVLEFWFHGDPSQRRQTWFAKDNAFDDEVRNRFTPLMTAAKRGELTDWEMRPESTLALVLVCDQFPRNAYRGTPAAFELDPIARQTANLALSRGDDKAMTPHERAFLYLPFEHSEDLDDQLRAVELFTRLAGEHPEQKMYLDYALQHHQVIARFERFPHRNTILQRPSTLEELVFLRENPGW